jgi:hypothetical protein
VGIFLVFRLNINKLDVIPAKAGIHPEIFQPGIISRWIPAFAGMTSSIGQSTAPNIERADAENHTTPRYRRHHQR